MPSKILEVEKLFHTMLSVIYALLNLNVCFSVTPPVYLIFIHLTTYDLTSVEHDILIKRS